MESLTFHDPNGWAGELPHLVSSVGHYVVHGLPVGTEAAPNGGPEKRMGIDELTAFRAQVFVDAALACHVGHGHMGERKAHGAGMGIMDVRTDMGMGMGMEWASGRDEDTNMDMRVAYLYDSVKSLCTLATFIVPKQIIEKRSTKKSHGKMSPNFKCGDDGYCS